MDHLALEKKLVRLVRRAAKIPLARDFSVEQKSSAADIVTSADYGVQSFLQRELVKLLPGSGFLCEEKNVNDAGRECVWVIDPIDGTTNFARGIDDYAISVALLRAGQPAVGAVYNPVKREMYSASAGAGARLNGRRIAVSDTPFGQGLLCTAMSLYRKEFAPVCFDIIAEAYGMCGDIRRFGSCATELCYLASGRCDLYFELRVFPWDYAAALLILKEAGGILKGLHGAELTFDRPTVLVGANSEENYRKLEAVVGKYLKSVPYEETLG